MEASTVGLFRMGAGSPVCPYGMGAARGTCAAGNYGIPVL